MNQVATSRRQPVASNNPRDLAISALAGEERLISVRKARGEVSSQLQRALERPHGLRGEGRARWTLEWLPTDAEAQAADRDFAREIEAPADDRVNRIFVALLVDAYPNSRAQDLGTFVETLLQDLRDRGYPPIVVAAALRHLRTTQRFLPSISEVLAQCKLEKYTMSGDVSLYRRVTDERARAQEVLALYAASNSPPEQQH